MLRSEKQMKKILVIALIALSGCLGTRHGNPMRREAAPVTSSTAAIPGSRAPAPEEPAAPGGEYY